MKITKFWRICLDADSDAAAAAEAAAAAAAAAEAAKKAFSQEDVNTLLAKERRGWQEKLTQQIGALEAIKKDGLTPEAKAELEKQIETLRNQTATTEELARQALGKREKAWNTEREKLIAERDAYAKDLDGLQIQTALDTAMGLHRVKAGATAVIAAYLRSGLQKVPVLDEAGKPTGRQSYVVQVPSYDAETKQTKVLQLTPPEAVAQMREQEEFAALFETAAKAGMGQSGGAGGSSIDVKNLTQEQYMELRKTNPSALGLRK
jgi:hypothetical protein